jgi:serine/threonine-protein kinase HipA
MNRCPITYDICENTKYSQKGLKLLAPKLKELHDFAYTAKEQLELALQYATKLSIQGVQPKLSTKLNITKGLFEIVESGGTFIFKPPHHIYSELPQNEDVTMRLAKTVGLEVPLHGMIYNRDGSFTYFIKRFDRLPKGHKVAVEDFSQLMGFSRETKYDSSMEKLIPTIEKHCTFPTLEKIKLFRLTLFNLLVGNKDMHLKNFSLIRREKQVCLSPAYDLFNSSIVISSGEEIALPLRGKKSRLTAQDLFD